jgi:hypothetical protein
LIQTKLTHRYFGNDCIDAEIEKIKKSTFRTRIKNYLLKTIIEIPHEEIEKTVAIAVGVKSDDTKVIVDNFPIKDADTLNKILNEFRFDDSTFFDETMIEENELFEVLLNWELRCEHGFHNHDGDDAEYTATFISPNGTEYVFETEMSLMCDGWNITQNEI